MCLLLASCTRSGFAIYVRVKTHQIINTCTIFLHVTSIKDRLCRISSLVLIIQAPSSKCHCSFRNVLPVICPTGVSLTPSVVNPVYYIYKNIINTTPTTRYYRLIDRAVGGGRPARAARVHDDPSYPIPVPARTSCRCWCHLPVHTTSVVSPLLQSSRRPASRDRVCLYTPRVCGMRLGLSYIYCNESAALVAFSLAEIDALRAVRPTHSPSPSLRRVYVSFSTDRSGPR